MRTNPFPFGGLSCLPNHNNRYSKFSLCIYIDIMMDASYETRHVQFVVVRLPSVFIVPALLMYFEPRTVTSFPDPWYLRSLNGAAKFIHLLRPDNRSKLTK